MSDYTLPFDGALLQFDIIHALLKDGYWTPGIARAQVERAFGNSLAVGAFTAAGEQVGCARMVTDRSSFGYLADVMVDKAHLGRGLGRAMTQALLDHPDIGGLRRIMLVTRDAHGVYGACGFEPVIDSSHFMQIHRPKSY